MEYRGHTIEKYHNNELVPNRIIRQYYQEQKERIDSIIDIENKRKSHKNIKTVNECLDDFFKEMEE